MHKAEFFCGLTSRLRSVNRLIKYALPRSLHSCCKKVAYCCLFEKETEFKFDHGALSSLVLFFRVLINRDCNDLSLRKLFSHFAVQKYEFHVFTITSSIKI